MRRGAVLVYIVLALAGAVGLVAFALTWSASSGYAIAAVDAARLSTQLAQDSLAEAATLAFEGPVTGAAPAELIDLREKLYDALENTLKPGGETITQDGVSVRADVPPGRIPGLSLPGGDISIERLTYSFHGFKPVAYGEGAVFSDPRVFYSERSFRDETKDLQPRDFQGFLSVEIEVASRERGKVVRRTQTSTRDAKVVDVTPPAREFGVFSYGAPPDAAYMLNDLNEGGRLHVYPRASRAFVRGPLFLKVEDAAETTHLGGDLRTTPSLSFPENGRDWHGWAYIPGPRAVHMNNFTGAATDYLNGLGNLLGMQGGVTGHPRRPNRMEDRVETKILGIPLPGVALVGPALNAGVGAFFPIPSDEEIACAQPWVYLTGCIPPGKQTFSIGGDADPTSSNGADATKIAMYDGILTEQGGAGKGVYREGMRFPHQKYAGGQEVRDGDAIYPEPFVHERSAAAPERPADHGIYGVYKIAEFRRDLIFQLRMLDFLGAFWPPAKTLVVGAESLLRRLGVTPDIWLLLVNWYAHAPKDLDGKLDPDLLTEGLSNQSYLVAPYGLYYETPHNRAVMMELSSLMLAAGISYAASSLERGLLRPIFERHRANTAKVSEKAVATIKEKRFGMKFPKTADKSAKLTHGTIRWFSDSFVSEGFKFVMKVLLKLVFNGVVDNVAFIGTWKAVGYLRKRHLRAALGKIAQWEPSPMADDVVREFPKGLYPSKYRPYARVASRLYDTFDDLLAKNTDENGILRLDDVVLVKELAYKSAQPLKYRGRGVIVALGGKGGEGPVLDAPVVREDPLSYLTLVVEDVGDDAPGQPVARSVALGPVFQGTVYATSGARPAGDRSLILGNLITLHLYKSRIAMTSRMDVVYDQDRLPAAMDQGGRRDWWRLSVSPRSSGLME